MWIWLQKFRKDHESTFLMNFINSKAQIFMKENWKILFVGKDIFCGFDVRNFEKIMKVLFWWILSIRKQKFSGMLSDLTTTFALLKYLIATFALSNDLTTLLNLLYQLVPFKVLHQLTLSHRSKCVFQFLKMTLNCAN